MPELRNRRNKVKEEEKTEEINDNTQNKMTQSMYVSDDDASSKSDTFEKSNDIIQDTTETNEQIQEQEEEQEKTEEENESDTEEETDEVDETEEVEEVEEGTDELDETEEKSESEDDTDESQEIDDEIEPHMRTRIIIVPVNQQKQNDIPCIITTALLLYLMVWLFRLITIVCAVINNYENPCAKL
jgi:hypothetical protein